MPDLKQNDDSQICLKSFSGKGSFLNSIHATRPFEIEDSWFKDLKYKYTDIKRKVSAPFEESVYIMSGSDEGDFSSLEMMMSADDRPYTAIIEDYEAFKKYKPGTKGIPLFIKTENKNGREVHINISCDMIK